MNINYLSFLEIGNCLSESNINSRVNHNLYGFCIEDNELNFKKLKAPANINKLYIPGLQDVNINSLIEIYNIVSIDYLKINSSYNYLTMDKFTNISRKLIIDKIEIGPDINEAYFQKILSQLIAWNYSLVYAKEKKFLISNLSVSRLILNPNLLDNIFIENIKKLDNI